MISVVVPDRPLRAGSEMLAVLLPVVRGTVY